jgi:hypothetical protein
MANYQQSMNSYLSVSLRLPACTSVFLRPFAARFRHSSSAAHTLSAMAVYGTASPTTSVRGTLVRTFHVRSLPITVRGLWGGDLVAAFCVSPEASSAGRTCWHQSSLWPLGHTCHLSPSFGFSPYDADLPEKVADLINGLGCPNVLLVDSFAGAGGSNEIRAGHEASLFNTAPVQT